MHRFRNVVGILLTCLLAVSTAACGSGSGRVTLTLGDQVKGLQTLLDASGVLENTPYDVEWAQFQGAAPLFEAVRAGSTDTASAADLPTLQAVSGGVPIKSIAAVRSSGDSVTLLARPGSPVRSVADLKGKDVVVSSAKGSISEYLLARALAEAHLSYSDVHVRYLLPTDAQAAFSSGKIDVWATFGVYSVKALQGGARELVNGADGRTTGIGLLSASDEALADPRKRAAITDLLQRVARAYEWSRTHHAEYVRAYAESNHVDQATAEKLVEQGYGRLDPMTPPVQQAVQEVSDTMNGIGSLPRRVDVSATTDATLFPASSPR